MQTKSPFYIVDDFISPLQCEDIIERSNNVMPTFDSNDMVLQVNKNNKLTDNRLLQPLKEIIEKIEKYYGFEYKAITRFSHEWYPEKYKSNVRKCDNSVYSKNNGWKKINENDFTGIIFLNEYNDKAPLDPYFEVKGGKYEFPTHNFGFNPIRGTLIIHPSGPNFVYNVSNVEIGDLNLIRFHIEAEGGYKYDMNNFQGNYKTWF
jgi:hypothetical protein